MEVVYDAEGLPVRPAPLLRTKSRIDLDDGEDVGGESWGCYSAVNRQIIGGMRMEAARLAMRCSLR